MTRPPDRARAHVFVATSVDGYIARADGSLDWLQPAHHGLPADTAPEDFGYADFLAASDVLVMGSATYATVAAFDPWPYGDKPVVVLTQRAGGPAAPPLAPALAGRVSLSAEAPLALLQRLAAQGLRRVYLDGGRVVQAFLREGLVDTLTVTQVPVLLGQGRPLWGALPGDVLLKLQASRHWPHGVVQQVWQVAATAGP
jgi:dihydrofolate reductase